MPGYQPSTIGPLVPVTPATLLLESLSGWRLITASSEQPGLRERHYDPCSLAFSDSTEPIRLLQNIWESVLQTATLDPQTRSITFSPIGNWKLFQVKLTE